MTSLKSKLLLKSNAQSQEQRKKFMSRMCKYSLILAHWTLKESLITLFNLEFNLLAFEESKIVNLIMEKEEVEASIV